MAQAGGRSYDGGGCTEKGGWEAAAMTAKKLGVRTRCLMAGACALLAWAAATTATAPAGAREFRAADIQGENYPTVQALRFIDQQVTAATGGRHRIRVFHSRQLGEESQTIEQTRVGAIDLDRINVGAISNAAPVVNALAMPFLFRSIDHLRKVVDGPIGEEILAALEPHGFVGLAFYDSGARSFYTARQPVRSMADLKGLRLRVQQSDLMDNTVKAFGAIPVPLPFGQVLTAISASLVDGAENNWPSFVAAGHYRAARYYTLTEHTMGPEILIMSQRAWDELSVQDRTIFRNAARQSSRYMREQWQDFEERSRKQAVDSGVTVIDRIDRTPFEQATQPLRDRLRGDPNFGSLIQRIEAVR
jgi:tripartite ATP-independent transporter DctP family solute receptor